ncbi:MAG: PLD nuclease N-terminal domain-containing protein [Methanosarcinaceae archaeon]|nr:PLD nuclease N-terminal domain-containing protein [Methanosarcinaceae archaeon]
MFRYSIILLIFGGIYLVSLVLWVWTLADCLKKETDEKNTRLIWVIVIVFTYILGAFLYYLIRRPKRIKELGK